MEQNNRLLEKMFEYDRWCQLIDKAEQKGINKTVLRSLIEPQMRLRLYTAIKTEQYEVSPPRIILIPKDKPNEFREVKANEDVDRIVLTLINDCLMELFPEMVHKSCRSYQKGIGCSEIVQKVSREVVKLQKENKFCAYKSDLSKYFDSVSIECIDKVFDTVEQKLGYKYQTEPVMNLLRKYYHSDWLFDVDGNLVEQYTSMKQGCACAAFISNAVLYDVDETLTQMCKVYVRYSDDMLICGDNADEAIETLQRMLSDYGLSLNPKKVQKLNKEEWFTFLGFKLKGDMITLSRNRVKNFQKTIEQKTIKHKKITGRQAKNNIINYLYRGDGSFSWATSCLGVINVKDDIDELNKFLMDCIRACETGKKKIGGLGSVDNLPDRTIVRGTGKNVTANRKKTEKTIKNYLSVGCLSNDYKIGKPIFETVVRGLQ